MDKNTKTAGVAITTLGLFFSLYISFTMGSTPFAFFTPEAKNGYVLNLGSEKNRSNIAKSIAKAVNTKSVEGSNQELTFDAVTENGNVIEFGYENIDFLNSSKTTKRWGAFNADSTLYNITPISGMTSIEVDFSNNESLDISYGWINDETGEFDYKVEGIVLNKERSSFSFFDDGPELLKISNRNNAPVALSGVNINYACDDTSDPYESDGGEFTFEFDSTDNDYSISSYSGNGIDIVIPTKVFDGEHSAYVTEIADSAFEGYYLQTLTMPNTVTTIGEDAFYDCTSLHTVTLSASLTEIGDDAFGNCYSLSNITIPSTVTSIGEGAFTNCFNLTSINIPTGLETIEANTFLHCHSLNSITIPNSVTSIGQGAFQNCNNMTSAKLSENLVTIGNNAFQECQKLTEIDIPDSVTSIGNNAFYKCYQLASVDLSENLTSIGDYAFSNCGALAKINIPDNVVSIGANAFESCWALSSVVLPTSLQSIGANAFSSTAWGLKLFYEGSSLTASLSNSLSGMESKLYFYSETSNTDGKHWHYVGGEPTLW